ncbi:unnamed protein product [Cylicocyclus nassatus]|uniref:Uncharacterized protein n=1 Tax=Cylicocyclus nassatus TaxID=53992 RepID=A0AA36DSN4_CYLNA|nr:unnamed protein product [Cylicocyclus nassatus]
MFKTSPRWCPEESTLSTENNAENRMRWALIGLLLLNTLGTVISQCAVMDKKTLTARCHAVRPCITYCEKKKCRPGVCIKKVNVNAWHNETPVISCRKPHFEGSFGMSSISEQ